MTFYPRHRTGLMVPGALTLALLVIFSFHWHIPVIPHVLPLFALITIYYWAIYWPRLMPKWFVFLIGLIEDLIYGSPLGFHSIAYLLFWGLVISQRRVLMREPFFALWLIFIVFSALTAILLWWLFNYYYHQIYNIIPGLVQWLATIMLYPAFHWLFARMHLRFMRIYA